MKKMVASKTGHSLFVKSVSREELPKGLYAAENYKTFYVVKNFDDNGVTFMYLAKGHKDAPGQVVAWYAKSKAFWSSFGKSIESAIAGAQEDAWMYA